MEARTYNPFHQWIRLEQPRLGTKVVFATDDFFADKSRLIDPADPVFIADKFDDNVFLATQVLESLPDPLDECFVDVD